MTGFSLDPRQTSLLADIVAAAAVPSDDALPWPVLDQIKTLLHADCVCFRGYDTVLPRIWLDQGIEPWGEHCYETETAAEAAESYFWAQYWNFWWSNQARTGNYDTVTLASDFASLRRRRAIHCGDPGEFCRGELVACLPGHSSGRHFKFLAWRIDSDFTERDRFLLSLLRPHLERTYWSAVRTHQEPPPLTRRQVQVLRMVQAGLTNRQIANRVGLSEATVRTHLNGIYARLGVHSRTAAVHRIFHEAGEWPTMTASTSIS